MMRQWAHLGYLGACEAALRACGIETVGTDAGADGLRSGSIEALVLGRRGYLELLDLGWTEEHGWGYSRRVDGSPSEEFEHGQFGGGVLPEPEYFAELVVRIAAGEKLTDHVPGERLSYRTKGDGGGFGAELLAYGRPA